MPRPSFPSQRSPLNKATLPGSTFSGGHAGFGGRGPQQVPRHGPFGQPFTASPCVGGDKAQRHPVNVIPRAHGFVQRSDPQSNASGARQATVGVNEPCDICDEARVAFDVGKSCREVCQDGWFIVHQVQYTGFGQGLTSGQDRLGECRDVNG
jgi:hypothetical protein